METIRRHCVICGTEAEMPADTLAGMAAAPELIAEAVRPALAKTAEGWSPSEIAAHLADTELWFGWRIRRILSEDTPTLQLINQDEWAAALRYGERDAEVALQAYTAQRRANVEIMSWLSDEDWERRYLSPRFGTVSLRALVRHRSDHDLAHLRQIRG